MPSVHQKLKVDPEDKEDMDYNLANPYCRVAQIVMQLTSMELGSPPLYAELNRVCRMMDYK